MACVLVLARFCEPASELHIAEDWFRRTALGDLLGISDDKVNDDRLYRALDKLLPCKGALEVHLKQRLGRLFSCTRSADHVLDRSSRLKARPYPWSLRHALVRVPPWPTP